MLRVGDHETSSFVLAPKGIHAATCSRVEDLGLVKDEFDGKERTRPKIRIHWALETRQSDGSPYEASKRYTLSSYVDAPLRQDVTAWLGREFSEREFKDFDLLALEGRRCRLVIVHETKNGKTYANVTAVSEPEKAAGFGSLSKEIEEARSLTHLDAIREKAVTARRLGGISREEMMNLGALSTQRREALAALPQHEPGADLGIEDEVLF